MVWRVGKCRGWSQQCAGSLATEPDDAADEGFEVTHASEKSELIAKVAAENDVSAEVIEKLLSLEEEFKNLHAYGVRPRFRSRIGEIVDRALEREREAH